MSKFVTKNNFITLHFRNFFFENMIIKFSGQSDILLILNECLHQACLVAQKHTGRDHDQDFMRIRVCLIRSQTLHFATL